MLPSAPIDGAVCFSVSLVREKSSAVGGSDLQACGPKIRHHPLLFILSRCKAMVCMKIGGAAFSIGVSAEAYVQGRGEATLSLAGNLEGH